MTFRRAAALVAATSMLVGGLAACGDEEPTQPTTTASPIDKGTDSPSESATDPASETVAAGPGGVTALPEKAEERSKAGAIAFNEFYQLQTGEALHSGETEFLEFYSDTRCKVCMGMIERVEEYASQGITMNKNPNSVSHSMAKKRSDRGYRVEVTVVGSKYHQIRADGSAGPTAQPLTMTIVTDTQWSDGHWEIRDQVRVK